MIRVQFDRKRLFSGRFQQATIYFATQVFQRGLSLLLIPLYSRYLPPAEYGIIATCNSLSPFVAILSCMCVYERLSFSILSKEADQAEYISTVLWFELAAVGFCIFLLSVFYWIFNLDTFIGVPFYPYIFLTILYSLLSVFFYHSRFNPPVGRKDCFLRSVNIGSFYCWRSPQCAFPGRFRSQGPQQYLFEPNRLFGRGSVFGRSHFCPKRTSF